MGPYAPICWTTYDTTITNCTITDTGGWFSYDFINNCFLDPPKSETKKKIKALIYRNPNLKEDIND